LILSPNQGLLARPNFLLSLKISVMDLKQIFEQAAEDSKNLKERPSNDTLLQLYSLFKQATVGDVNVEPPANPFDFLAKAKYGAWKALKGKTPEEAMKEYVGLVSKLKT
jgi:diazepam-binding inhibitor (GABA receptor modulator, acyl-CoA-binding protein)